MPVRKFRSVEDMPSVRARTPLDPENLRLACSLSQFASWLHPMKHVPGVRKYRSVEEASRARQEWVRSQLGRPVAGPKT
jgi:hypothetical protein